MQRKKYKLIFQAVSFDDPFNYYMDNIRESYIVSRALINYAKKVYETLEIHNIELHQLDEESGLYDRTTIFDKYRKSSEAA